MAKRKPFESLTKERTIRFRILKLLNRDKQARLRLKKKVKKWKL